MKDRSHDIEGMVQQLLEALPPGLSELKTEFAQQIKLSLQNVLQQMDVVPREEFDAQCKVLARTRAMIEPLEARIAELETKLADKNQ